MASEIEELRVALEKKEREKRKLEATRDREERKMKTERLQLLERVEALEKERREPRREEVPEEHHEEEEVHHERQAQEEDPDERRFARLIKVVQGTGGKGMVDLPMYQGKMESEEVLGWIEALENYFELEDIDEDKKVKVAKARLRGTTLRWWTNIQNGRIERGLDKISSWVRMKTMVKHKLLPLDLAIQLKMRRNILK